jgi:flagellar motor switch/type III secretory pathway protein FliN
VEKTLKVRPFPWAGLEEIPREAVGLLRDTRRALRRAVDFGRIGKTLGELVGSPVEILPTYFGIASFDAASSSDVTVPLGTADDTVRVEVALERDFAAKLVAMVIGRPARLHDPRAHVDAALAGATAAIVCKIARQAHGFGDALRPLGHGALRLQQGERRFEIRATVLIGEDAFSVRATIQLARLHADAPPADELLSSLGSLPISLPVVAAIATASPVDVEALVPGDVFLPGGGWRVARDGHALVGGVLLVAPDHDRALEGRLGTAGEIVLVGVTSAPLDGEAAMERDRNDESSAPGAILEAPLIVRVELGAVTMTAREWALLAPGDVISLGKRVGELAVLRIAGVEVARGELVDVEGELGIKIRTREGTT